MDIELYDRKPFTVEAVQVTPQNVAEVAKWVGGEVVTVPTRMVGTTVDMPAVKAPFLKGDKGKVELATIGTYVVGRKGSFRVYKSQSFLSTFNKRPSQNDVENPLPAEAQKELDDVTALTEDDIASRL